MPKVAFIVEPEFLHRHWGVRVYLYSLAKVLERHKWTVDFVYPEVSSAGDLRWYKVHVRDESLFSSAAPSAEGTPSDVWAALRDVAIQAPSRQKTAEPVPPGRRRPGVMPIGSSLALEHYDLALVTNPWMVRWSERLPARMVAGLVFDLIPSLFGMLLDEGKPFVFAHQHERGFRYFEESCDLVLTISETTRDAYLDLVRSRRPGSAGPDVVALPPLAPYHALDDLAHPCATSRPSRIALAGCFDPRKGLKELPALLNGVSDLIEEVIVYGGVRCPKAAVEAFFRDLRVEHIVWHLGATAGQVRDIFQRSKLLVFPSKYEGLGLPLLEAQLEGCRVATYPMSPMKELGLSGAVMLSEDPAESVARLRTALQEPFDHAALQAEARPAFVETALQTNPLGRLLNVDRPAHDAGDRRPAFTC